MLIICTKDEDIVLLPPQQEVAAKIPHTQQPAYSPAPALPLPPMQHKATGQAYEMKNNRCMDNRTSWKRKTGKSTQINKYLPRHGRWFQPGNTAGKATTQPAWFRMNIGNVRESPQTLRYTDPLLSWERQWRTVYAGENPALLYRPEIRQRSFISQKDLAAKTRTLVQ